MIAPRAAERETLRFVVASSNQGTADECGFDEPSSTFPRQGLPSDLWESALTLLECASVRIVWLRHAVKRTRSGDPVVLRAPACSTGEKRACRLATDVGTPCEYPPCMDGAYSHIHRDYEFNKLNSDSDFEVILDFAGPFFRAMIGDKENGFRFTRRTRTLEAAVGWLQSQAREFYPQSRYVRELACRGKCLPFSVARRPTSRLRVPPLHAQERKLG